MTIEFVCGECGRELKADERSIGRKVRCPQCTTLLIIPNPAEAEDESEQGAASEPVEDPRPQPAPEPESAPQNAEAPQKKAGKRKRQKDQPRRPEPPPVSPPPVSAADGTGSRRAFVGPQRVEEALLFPAPKAHPEDLIDMTAMVDIVFFLLIFFLVTSLQALESVMNLPTPQAAEGSVSTGKSVAELENDPNLITVRIEDDDSIWVEDVQVFSDQDLAIKLRTARKEVDGSCSLLVIGSADASHGTAVRVFDAGAGAGVNGISLIVQEADATK